MIESLISEKIILKAKEVKIFKQNETASAVYFIGRYCGRKGISEYFIDYKKDNSLPLIDRIVCGCKYHVLNPLDFHLCAYSLAMLIWLGENGYLRKEYISSIINGEGI